jgi:hypothetical protein
MAVTININDLTLAHKGSDGTAIATMPDVCKTPSPGGPVPLPYPNIAVSADLAKGTTTVKADGGNMCANKGSELSKSTGDEPGTAGGVTSSTNMKEATWMLYSMDVMLEGKNACRLTDKLFMNHENTVCLAGWLQTYEVTVRKKGQQAGCEYLEKYINDTIGRDRGGKGKIAKHRGLTQRIRQNRGFDIKPGTTPSPPGTPGWKTHDDCIKSTKKNLATVAARYAQDCKKSPKYDETLAEAKEAQDWKTPTKEDWGTDWSPP